MFEKSGLDSLVLLSWLMFEKLISCRYPGTVELANFWKLGLDFLVPLICLFV